MNEPISYILRGLHIPQLKPWAYRVYRDFLMPHSEHITRRKIVLLGNTPRLIRQSHCIEILVEFYTNEFFQKKAYASLPEPFRQLFYSLTWNYRSLKMIEIIKLFELKLPEFEYYASRGDSINFTPWLHFFFIFGYAPSMYSIANQIRVFLPLESALLARTWLPKPKNFELHVHQIPEADTTVYSGVSPDVFYQFASLEAGKMIPRKKNGALRVAFARKLQGQLSIPQLTDQGKQTLITTEVLGRTTQMIHTVPIDDYRSKPADLLREHLFTLINNESIDYTRWFLPLIRMNRNEFHDTSIHLEPAITLLNKMNTHAWYSINELMDYIKFHNLSWATEQETLKYCKVNFIPGVRKTDEEFESEIKYDQHILYPFIQKTFVLFAVLGIIDLNLSPVSDQTGPETLQFSGRALSHIRLTDYGAYVIGRTSDYHNETLPVGNIVLDDDRLMLTLEGEDKCLMVSLELFATPLSKNRYQLNPVYFTKNTPDRNSLQEKIDQFKKLLSEDAHLPDVWNTFFNDLLSKKEALEVITGYVVLKMERNAKLINVLAEDIWLREHILKADQFHLIIKSDDFKEAQKRLNERGFTIANAKAAIPVSPPRNLWW